MPTPPPPPSTNQVVNTIDVGTLPSSSETSTFVITEPTGLAPCLNNNLFFYPQKIFFCAHLIVVRQNGEMGPYFILPCIILGSQPKDQWSMKSQRHE